MRHMLHFLILPNNIYFYTFTADKNPSSTAADEFRTVTEAFDVLGNPIERKQYDNKLRNEEQRQRQQRQQEIKRKQQQDRERKEKERKHQNMIHKARKGQGRMIQISTYEEFEKTMLDSSKRVYNTHCLLMFVGNRGAEKKAEDELYFPYPFTGEDNHNPYKSILKVAKIRFNQETELTRLFGAHLTSKHPHIIFGRKGDAVNKFQTLRTTNNAHDAFKKWVQSLLVIPTSIGNRHSLPVVLYIMRNGRVIHDDDVLNPNYQRTLSLHAGDHIYAYDQRLDTYMGSRTQQYIDKLTLSKAKGALLLDEIVTATSSAKTYTIYASQCYDLSTQCQTLTHTSRGMKNRNCDVNAEFYHNICPATCGVCSERITSGLEYVLFHRPIHTFPKLLHKVIRFGRYLADDVREMLELQKNSAFVFFVFGFLLAINILRWSNSSIGESSKSKDSRDESSWDDPTLMEAAIVLVAVNACVAIKFFMTTPRLSLPFVLQKYHRDLDAVTSNSGVFLLLIGAGIVAGIYTRIVFSSFGYNNTADMIMVIVLFILLGVKSGVVSLVMNSNKLLRIQYEYILMQNKHGAVAVALFGCIVGASLVSIWKLLVRLWKKKRWPITLVLSNVIALSAVGGIALTDPHFVGDIRHVLEMRKNAGFGFIVVGLLTGHLVLEIIM